MKVHSLLSQMRVLVVVVLAVSVVAMAEEPKASKAPNLPKFGKMKFERFLLIKNKNEGCAVADVDMDGKLDVIGGPNWFQAPDWRPRPIRDIGLALNDEFMQNNGDHAMDLNGDGWVDVISGSWFSDKLYWYENPGQVGLERGKKWAEHLISEGHPNTEGTLLVDLDGDGSLELLVDSWTQERPLMVIRIKPGKNRAPTVFTPFKLGPTCGHGMGVGDINGDGRLDVVVSRGWYEAPEGDRFKKEWTYHQGPDLGGHASLPVLVVDVNGDGKNDIIYGDAHEYGLKWVEQVADGQGKPSWKEHVIDKDYSQMHDLVWADLDGDGKNEIITGKRYRAHGDGDPGAHDPVFLLRYVWNAETKQFDRDVISYDDGISSGMQIRVVDLDGDKKLDLAVAGKTGTYVLLNRGLRDK